MKRLAVAVAVVGLVLSACGSGSESDGKLSIVAAFYPVAAAAQHVGGELVHVSNLTPAGVEPHELELTSDDVDLIENADLVLYVGAGFQPAVESAVKRRDRPSIDVAAGLISRKADPHFWLDPDLMAKAVAHVRAALTRVDNGHTATFKTNADDYVAKLHDLAAEYATGLGDCARYEIVTAHAAFGYLAARFGLVQHGVTGIEPEGEPDAGRIAELSDLIRDRGVTTVFYEELVPRDFADTLAKDAGVKTAVLNPLEALTKKQIAAGDDYLSVMRDNLGALTAALNCG